MINAKDRLVNELQKKATILFYDTERAPGEIVMKVWDRKMRESFLPMSAFSAQPINTIFSYYFYEEGARLKKSDVKTISLWDYPSEKEFVQAVYEVFKQPHDAEAGHFISGADRPWWLGDFYKNHGLKPLEKKPQIDTKRMLDAIYGRAGAMFKSLGDFTKERGITTKSDFYSMSAMEKALKGDERARKRLEKYCDGDVIANVALYLDQRGYWAQHPNLYPYKTKIVQSCKACGCEKYEVVSYSYTKTRETENFQCKKCGLVQKGINYRGI